MKSRPAIVEMLRRRDLRIAHLAKRIGKPASYITDKLSDVRGTDNIGVETLSMILNGMDYRLVAVPNEVATPKGGISLD